MIVLIFHKRRHTCVQRGDRRLAVLKILDQLCFTNTEVFGLWFIFDMFQFFLAANGDLRVIFSYACLLEIVVAAFDFVVVGFRRN